MKKTYLQKGFTLIELLVVIAIIGILSSVVLASLSTARTKGTAAKVQSQLSSMRAQAELYYSTTGSNSYGSALPKTTCSTAAANLFGTGSNTMSTLLTDVISTVTAANTQCAIGNLVEATSPYSSSATSWAVSAQDPSTAGTYYCVDSSGTSKRAVAASAAASITVDATSARCS